MEKKTIIYIAICAVLTVYLVFAMSMTRAAERADHYTDVHIEINDSLSTGFVTAADISRHFGSLQQLIADSTRSSVDIADLERRLMKMSVIERANVAPLNDGSLQISVSPMTPVARIFTTSGKSYYINATGKNVPADSRYHVDVPVVVSDNANFDPTELLPMLSYIAADPTLNALVSTVTVSKRGDVMIVPVIRGQIINFGHPTDFADKFARLKTFYTKVIPVKGWNTYDTISVKWAAQVVATRRDKSLGHLALDTNESEFDLIDDISTMTSDLSTDTISNHG